MMSGRPDVTARKGVLAHGTLGIDPARGTFRGAHDPCSDGRALGL